LIHPCTEIVPVDPRVGLGVRATRAIPRGTIVWALDRFDIVLAPAELAALDELHRALAERYGYRDHHGRCIVCWDGGRFVNHSCAPAMRGVGPEVMVAVRDLAAGDELTCDYAECNTDPPLDCHCGEACCRGRVGGQDLLRYHEPWDAEVRAALAAAARVEQPLWPVVRDPRWLHAVFEGRCPPPSLREIYLDRAELSRKRTA